MDMSICPTLNSFAPFHTSQTFTHTINNPPKKYGNDNRVMK